MHKLITRYLDGELSESEATQFIEALETDTELAAELYAHERIQAAGRSLGDEPAPAGFADRVMAQLPRAHMAPAPRRVIPIAWRSVWPVAAAVVVAFGLGRVTTNLNGDVPVLTPYNDRAVAASFSVQPVAFASKPGEDQNLRLVQITYDKTGAETVSVAGTFNGWKADKVPMHKADGLWTAVLVLPPGSYEYMFIEDGKHWVTDPGALRTRDDGFGGRNAVLDLGV